MRVVELHSKEDGLSPSFERVSEIAERITNREVDTVVMDIDMARMLEGWEWESLREAGLTTVTLTSELVGS